MLIQETLKQLLDYDENTGIFRWKVNRSNIKIGSIAGSLSTGYIRIKLFNKLYLAHRLAWLYVYGAWPLNFIDHINEIRDDNRLCNLREATRAENNRNTGKRSNNTSGYKGVTWRKDINKWAAQIMVNKKQIHLGNFDDKADASLAYQNAAYTYHGKFSKF